MRLTRQQIASIQSVARQILSHYSGASLWLFGSRLNDEAKGGDADFCLFVTESDVKKRAQLKRQLRPALEEAIDIPTDLVVQDNGSTIKKVAKKAKEEGVQIV